jgi:hypothetical protein
MSTSTSDLRPLLGCREQNKHPPVPFKRTVSLRAELTSSLTRYIGDNFKEVSVEAFKSDVARLASLREAAVEAGVEVHREWVGKLVRSVIPHWSFR